MNRGSPPGNGPAWRARPGNENAPAQGQGASQSFPEPSKPQSQDGGNKDYEERRNAAACFRNERKQKDWQPAYTGVMVVEGLQDGDKCWINVHVRQTRRGDKYLSVVLKRQER
jgi:hypothetical protein